MAPRPKAAQPSTASALCRLMSQLEVETFQAYFMILARTAVFVFEPLLATIMEQPRPEAARSSSRHWARAGTLPHGCGSCGVSWRWWPAEAGASAATPASPASSPSAPRPPPAPGVTTTMEHCCCSVHCNVPSSWLAAGRIGRQQHHAPHPPRAPSEGAAPMWQRTGDNPVPGA